MSCPVTPTVAIEEPIVEIDIASASKCDQTGYIVILYNGQANYDGTYNYGQNQ